MEWATKDGFFGAKVPVEQMEVSGIGLIKVYGLTQGQKDDFENAVVRISGRKRQVNLANARAKLLIMTVRNNQGRPLFTEADMGKISEIPAIVTEPILDTARRLSGMSAEEMDELAKNSPKASEPNPSDSR
jgi:hypothetical protein